MREQEIPITTGQFLKLLYDKLLCRYGYEESDYVSRGRREGWLTEEEELREKEPLSRGAAARILHEISRRVIKEAEEEEWGAAAEMADLFDCNRCVIHVAQMYVKGIMEATSAENRGTLRFGAEEFFSKDAAELAVERLSYPEKRNVPPKKARLGTTARKISRMEAETLLREPDGVIAVDVGQDTPETGFAKKLRIPMMRLLENPFLLEQYRKKVLLLYCSGGYQSETAAICLSAHGYPYVFYFGLEKNVE